VIPGGNFDPEARYIDPTILYPVTWDDPIMDDEIFGPLLPILTYGDLKHAFSEIKKSPKPLSAFLFSATLIRWMSGVGALWDTASRFQRSYSPLSSR
jgi:acyl-CoA reductase-like NAD-dependent aldehyde dehydrogenase